jgi:hypothetical protein
MQGPNCLAPEASLAEEGCKAVPPECRKCLVDGGYPWPHPDWGSRGPTWAAAGSSIPPAILPSQHQPASTRTASRRGSSSIRHSPITKCSMQSKLREQNPVSIKPLSKGNCPRMGPCCLGAEHRAFSRVAWKPSRWAIVLTASHTESLTAVHETSHRRADCRKEQTSLPAASRSLGASRLH